MIFGLGGGKNVICGTRWVKQSLSDSQNQEEESSSLLRDVFNRKKKGTGDAFSKTAEYGVPSSYSTETTKPGRSCQD